MKRFWYEISESWKIAAAQLAFTVASGCAHYADPYPSAEQTGIRDYHRVVVAAEASDSHALALLLSVTPKCDGLSAEFHSGYLRAVLEQLGDVRFAAALRGQPRAVRQSVAESLNFDGEVSKGRTDWGKVFPLTYRASEFHPKKQ